MYAVLYSAAFGPINSLSSSEFTIHVTHHRQMGINDTWAVNVPKSEKRPITYAISKIADTDNIHFIGTIKHNNVPTLLYVKVVNDNV